MNVADLLRTMDIFENLPPEDLDAIASMLRERRLEPDEVLFSHGEAGDAMYIVTGGRISLFTADADGCRTTLAQLTDGQFFGEMALLTGTPRSTSACADMESRLLVLQRQDFDKLLAGNAQIMREMLKVVSQRAVQTNQQLLAEKPSRTPFAGSGSVFVVFSPRGGSGKTTLAVNLAVALERLMPDRVALLDLCLAFPSAASLLDLTPQASLAQVPVERLDTMDRRMLAQYMVRHDSGVHLLTGAVRAEEGEAVTTAHVRSAIGVMKRQFMATVVDCPGVFSDAVLAAVEVADRLVLLSTPELASLRDVRECQRVLTEVVHVDRSRFSLVLNHHQPFKVLSRAQFETALEHPIAFEIPHAGELAARAAEQGQPLATTASHSPFVAAVDKLAFDLAPTDVREGRSRGPHLASAGNGQAPGQSRGLFSLLKRT